MKRKGDDWKIRDLSVVKRLLEPDGKELAWKMGAGGIEIHRIDIFKELWVFVISSRVWSWGGVVEEG